MQDPGRTGAGSRPRRPVTEIAATEGLVFEEEAIAITPTSSTGTCSAAHRSPRPRSCAVALGLLLAVVALPPAAIADGPGPHRARWFAAWSRPQAITTVSAAEIGQGARGPRPLVDQTVRVIVRSTGAGSAVRIHLANRYGSTPFPAGTPPLELAAATIGRRIRDAEVDVSTRRALTFGGGRGARIAPGATVVSDPAALPVAAGDDLAVSVHVRAAPALPAHGAAYVTSFVTPAGSGDHSGDVDGRAFTERTRSSPLVSAVDVRSTVLDGTIAATGGSVTDGEGSTLDGHDDFPSWLSRRIRATRPGGVRRTVVNHGIAGTTAAAACSVSAFGPSVEERLDHDTLGLAGLTHLIVYAGTNDLGFGCTGEQIIAAYRSIIRQAAGRNVDVLISTVTPRAAYTRSQNAERAKVNAWVRAGGNCRGECHRGLDFDAVVRDAENRDRLEPTLDSGDGIHPNARGYQLIAASIPLDALR